MVPYNLTAQTSSSSGFGDDFGSSDAVRLAPFIIIIIIIIIIILSFSLVFLVWLVECVCVAVDTDVGADQLLQRLWSVVV